MLWRGDAEACRRSQGEAVVKAGLAAGRVAAQSENKMPHWENDDPRTFCFGMYCSTGLDKRALIYLRQSHSINNLLLVQDKPYDYTVPHGPYQIRDIETTPHRLVRHQTSTASPIESDLGDEPTTPPGRSAKITMRHSIPLLALTATLTTALQLPNLQPFLSAIPISISDYIPQLAPNASSEEAVHENLRRQNSNTCPSSFNSCANLGAPGLCCSENAICAPDQGGHVACCPSGAACTGRISGVISSGSVDASGNVVGGGAVAGATGSTSGFGGLATASASATSTTQSFESAQATTSGNGLVLASTQTTAADGSGQTSAGGGGFIVDGGSTVATPGAAMRAAEMVSFILQFCRRYSNADFQRSRLLHKRSSGLWSFFPSKLYCRAIAYSFVQSVRYVVTRGIFPSAALRRIDMCIGTGTMRPVQLFLFHIDSSPEGPRRKTLDALWL